MHQKSYRYSVISWKAERDSYVVVLISYKYSNISRYIALNRRDSRVVVQNSYKLARTRRHVVGMSCGFVHISQNSYKYRINSYRLARVYLYFVMNIVDMSYGTRRTVLTKTLVAQLMDICGDMWRDITRTNSSQILGKLVTVGQGLKGRPSKSGYVGPSLHKSLSYLLGRWYIAELVHHSFKSRAKRIRVVCLDMAIAVCMGVRQVKIEQTVLTCKFFLKL